MQKLQLIINHQENLGSFRWQQRYPKLREVITQGLDCKPKLEFLDYISWEYKKYKTNLTVNSFTFKNVFLKLTHTPPFSPSCPSVQYITFVNAQFCNQLHLTNCPKLLNITLDNCTGVIKLVDISFKILEMKQDRDAYCIQFCRSRYENVILQGHVLDDIERVEFRRIQKTLQNELNQQQPQHCQPTENQDSLTESALFSDQTRSPMLSRVSSVKDNMFYKSTNKLEMSTKSLKPYSNSLMSQIQNNNKSIIQEKPKFTLESWKNKLDKQLDKDLYNWIKYDTQGVNQIKMKIWEKKGFIVQ